MSDRKKPFSLIEEKLLESEFFLEKMREAGANVNIFELRYYFSAFVSATRSVTFVMQSVLSSHPGFSEWYAGERTELAKNPLARFFVDRRNQTLKEGETRIHSASYLRDDETGERIARHYFTDMPDLGDVDVVSSSTDYFTELKSLVVRCQERFPERTPDWIFNIENLKKSSMTIEDLEEGLGFPRNWTAGVPDAERLRLLKYATPPLEVSNIIEKYIENPDSTQSSPPLP